VAGKREMFDVLRDGVTSHSGTYNGQHVNVAAALATVTALSADPEIYNRASHLYCHHTAAVQSTKDGPPSSITGDGARRHDPRGDRGRGRRRVRPHCRFRNSGADPLSESGMKWMRGGTKRHRGRTPNLKFTGLTHNFPVDPAL
jgi:hypothetical protein